MNLNPLENQKSLYNIEDIFYLESHNYDWDEDYTSLEVNKDLSKKLNCSYGGYDYLLYSITDKIDWFIKAGENDYQGDIFYLGKDNENKYYFLNQGYGSCSGCDAYQAEEWDCQQNKTLKPLEDLREDMKKNIKQFNSLDNFKEYLESEESKGNYYWHDSDFKDFVNQLNEKFRWNIKLEEEE